MARERHNSVLDRIIRAVPEHLGTKQKEQPIPGTSGANRPDLTITSPDGSSIILVEVSCPFEGSLTALEDAARSKLEKYEPLRQVLVLLQLYLSVEVFPLIVGSLGSWYPPNDRVLSHLHIGWSRAVIQLLLVTVLLVFKVVRLLIVAQPLLMGIQILLVVDGGAVAVDGGYVAIVSAVTP
ncbi:hypothetical protein EMCRGX_G005502 [Ephydatia muelleri]